MSGNKCGGNDKKPPIVTRDEPTLEGQNNLCGGEELNRPKIFQEQLRTPTRCRDTTNYFAFRKEIPGCDGKPSYLDNVKEACKLPSLGRNPDLGNLRTDGSGVSPEIQTSKSLSKGGTEKLDQIALNAAKKKAKLPQYYGYSRAFSGGIGARASVFFVGIFLGAYAFEKLFDSYADDKFDRINKGKLWKDIKDDYQQCRENEN